MIAAGIIFKTSDELDFVGELAGWISPPAPVEPAPAEDATAAEGEQPQAVQPSAFQQECLAQEAAGEFEPLYAKLAAALAERFGTEPETDVECVYTLLVQLLLKWELLPTKLLPLADELCGSTEVRPLLRRNLLLSLHSLVQQCGLVELRFAMLMKLLRFCSKTQTLDPLLGGAPKRIATVEKWVREWELSTEQKRDIWGVVFDTYVHDSAATYENALKYLPLHDESALQSDPQLRQRLVQAMLVTIRSSELLNCDKLAQLPVVHQLASDEEYKLLGRLLQICAREMYADYKAFYVQPDVQGFFVQHNLSHEACTRKMRLLTIVSLGQAAKELSYESIAAALEIPKDQVESWVVDAIASELLSAKMDQVRELVIVNVCLEREFGMQQWETLKTSLSQWGESVQGLLQVVVNSRPAPAQ